MQNRTYYFGILPSPHVYHFVRTRAHCAGGPNAIASPKEEGEKFSRPVLDHAERSYTVHVAPSENFTGFANQVAKVAHQVIRQMRFVKTTWSQHCSFFVTICTFRTTTPESTRRPHESPSSPCSPRTLF